MKYIIRIVALPFFAGLCLIGIVILYFKYLVNFVRFGGESVSYTNKNQRKCINDIYLELVDSRKSSREKVNLDSPLNGGLKAFVESRKEVRGNL